MKEQELNSWKVSGREILAGVAIVVMVVISGQFLSWEKAVEIWLVSFVMTVIMVLAGLLKTSTDNFSSKFMAGVVFGQLVLFVHFGFLS